MGLKARTERVTPMAEQSELALMTPTEELAAAKASPEGCYLSPAAQALYEAEGAARFTKYHRMSKDERDLQRSFKEWLKNNRAPAQTKGPT